jgi:nucleotide-binding universal stress UspA family protein
LISIPIVVWGSTLILKLVDRFPSIIYIGAAVLAWTAAKMIVTEPLVVAQLAGYAWVNWIIYALVFTFVLGGGYWANRAAAQKTDEEALAPEALSAPTMSQEETGTMSKILVPVDGTANAMQAVRFAVKTALGQGNIEVHLLHVRAPLPQHLARFLTRGERASWNAAEAERALSHARGLLMHHGLPFAEHIERGDPAHTIDRVARRLKVDQIVIGHSSIPLVGRLFRRSVTTTLTELTRVPVQVIAGKRGTLLVRWGIPAGVAILIALLLVASN